MLWLCVVVLHMGDGHDPKNCEADTSCGSAAQGQSALTKQ